MPMQLDTLLAEAAEATERELEAIFESEQATPPRLLEAMRYATLRAGKRFRPLLVHVGASLGDAERPAVLRVAAAVELIHCYSLIHDDLPAMDDAVLRRGKPALHRAYDEATAILAGDALNTLALAVLARADWPAGAALRLVLIDGLGRASGARGMCGGQMLDLESSNGGVDEAGLVRLQALKTGALIRFALRAGAVLAGLDEKRLAALDFYGVALGLAFQIRDDLLDVEAGETGKSSGRDAALGRTTFVTLFGVEEARRRLLALRTEALRAAGEAGVETSLLGDLFDFVIDRRS